MIASKVFQYQQTLCNRTNGRNFIAIRRFFESIYKIQGNSLSPQKSAEAPIVWALLPRCLPANQTTYLSVAYVVADENAILKIIFLKFERFSFLNIL